jgi:Uma2 family endonuclease
MAAIIAGKVHHRVESFIDAHPGVGISVCRRRFRLESDPDTVRAPDAWFVSAEHIPEDGIPDGFWPGAPTRAVEVLSPSDRFADVLRKVKEYLAAGARLVWVIDPKGRSAAVFGPGAPLAELLGEDGVLDGGDVLPGFTLRLRDVLP